MVVMWYVNATKFLILLSISLFALPLFAMNGRTTYQAKISKPDGYPLESTSVNFRFTVLDTVGSCILYVEDYAAINMQDTGGLVSFALGNGSRAFPTSGTSQTFQNVFDNSVASFPCQNAGIYNPGANDTRRVVMQFNEGIGWQTLPAMTINSVPYSMYASTANNSKTLNNKADTDFVEYAALTGLNCLSNEAIKFNGVSFSCIPVSGISVSGSVLAIGGTASAPVISMSAASMSSDGYLTSSDYTELKAKVSSVSATAPLASTGGSTPTISITQATSSSNGYLSAADFVTFNSKQNALGYTPLDSAVSGTFAVKANNLSDLTNIVTARTNLGLGTFAVANSLDLGSASATGIIDEARFANRSGVTSGTQYTKVTVDGKGFVTNGSQISSGDVTTALGYTPASASASTQWNTSGTTINYTNGFVGIGATGPSLSLHVAGVNGFPATSGTTQTGSLRVGSTVSQRVLDFGVNGATSTAWMQSTTMNSLGDANNLAINPNGGNVGIGTTSPAAKLEVAGDVRLPDAAVVQFGPTWGTGVLNFQNGPTTAAIVDVPNNKIVNNLGKYYTAATAPGVFGTQDNFNLQFHTNSINRMTIDTTGNVGIGTVAPLVPLQVNQTDPTKSRTIYSYFDPNLTANQASNLHGIWGELAPNSSYDMTGGYYAGVSRVDTGAAQSGAIAFATGLLGDVYHDGSGTIAEARGVTGAVANRSAGTITNARGGYFSIDNLASGTIVTGVGVFIGSVAGATNYGIYQTDTTADNYFAGNVGIGTTTPAAKLDVQGQVKTSMGTPLVNPTGEAVDFASGNTQYVTFSSCPGNALTVNLFSMFEGSSYSIVIVAPNGCLVDFTGISHAIGGSGGTAVTAFKYPAGQKFSSTGNPMVYSFLRANNFVFVAQVVDFQ